MLKLDSNDHKIIKELRDNSRLSVRQIGKKTGIRPSTVHLRIQRLIKQGVIEKFTLKLNNKLVGENFIVFMLLRTPKELEQKVFKNKYVKEAFGITGEYDLVMKLKFKDVEEFNDYVIKFRKEYQIRESLTMVVTANIKEEI